VPFFDLQDQTNELLEQVMQRVEQVCQSCCFTLGPEVERFEANFAAYCQADHCVAVNSGTSALHLALAAHGVGPGDEVITTPLTFVATAWAISYVGAKPVLVDVDPRTWNLDPTQLFDALTPRTKALLPVHLYGRPAEMDAILEISQEQGIPVIEDAAQAHGARYRGKRVGGIGAAGCFSFYPSKNLGAWGEGGALVTNDSELANKARALRDHGQFHQKGRHVAVGFNYRMISLQAAVLDVKLTRLDDRTAQRRRLAKLYLQRLSGTLGLEFPSEASDVDAVYHLFVVALADRRKAADQLRARGVATGIHYPIPVHLQPAYQHLDMRQGSLPVAERLAQQCLSLPMFPELKADQVNYVCDQLIASLAEQPQPAQLELAQQL
jgi:dTDP-4-amino-4,6-dideoxygalactose transaminase